MKTVAAADFNNQLNSKGNRNKRISCRLLAMFLSLMLTLSISMGMACVTVSAYDYETAGYSVSRSSVLYTEEDVLAFMRSQMVQRNNFFTVTLSDELGSLFSDAIGRENCMESDLFKKVFAHTGNPGEGDYLRNSTGFASVTDVRKNGGTAEYDLYVAYLTNVAWENAVDREIVSVLSELNLNSASDYDKIRAVHDYITKNVEYDYAHVGDNSSDYYPLQYTAYAALTKHTAVCKGYALLFQRLMTELGIESYCINSLAMDHSWNVVRLGNLFYYVDTTWDTTENTNKYFLRGTSDFSRHVNSDDEYSDPDFAKAHPRAQYAYYEGAEEAETSDIGGSDSEIEGMTDILGYAPKNVLKTADGTKFTTRAKNGRGMILIYGTPDCPFTRPMLEELAGRNINGVDICICINDTRVPADFPKIENAVYCVNKNSDDFSVQLCLKAFDLESGIADSWINSPSFFFVNAKNQIVYAEHGYVEGFEQLIDSYLGKDAPATVSGTEHTGSHSWELKNYIVKPTDTKEGKAKYVCTKCGKVDTFVLPNLHNEINGQCGDDLTWSFDTTTGTLTVSGRGRMWDNNCHPSKIGWVMDEEHDGISEVFAYIAQDKIRSVIIEEGVTSIGGLAFFDCPNLRSVTIPKSVKEIGSSEGYSAFDSESAPKTVYFGGSKKQWAGIKRYFDWDKLPDSKIYYNTDSCLVRLITGTKNYKASALKKSSKSFNLIAVRAHGDLTYTSLNKKYVSVTNAGKVTVKKGTPKGTYKIKVSAKSDGRYSSSSKTLKIVVK